MTRISAQRILPACRRLLLKWLPIAVLFAAIAINIPVAFAQQPLEEIVVTSQKREQRLMDVPIAISAYDSKILRDSGVHDLRDLTVLTPTIVLTSSQSEASGTTARIRGVGTTGDNLGLESSVGIFIDGVYRNRNNNALTELGELERIEVLRGPQGTLFGKNTTAGLINVVTKGPDTEEFGGFVEGSLGNLDQARISAALTGPVAGERLALRLDGTYWRREGFIEDIANPGVDYNDRDRYLIRGQLFSQITDDLDLRLIVDYTKRTETCCAAVTRIAGPTVAAIQGVGGTMVIPPDPFARNMTSNAERGFEQDVDEAGISAEFNWEIGAVTLTSITAYRDWESDRSQEGDYTDADIIYRNPGTVENAFETLTQELRLAGMAGPVDWLVGGYYVDEDLDFRDAIRVGADYENYVNALIVGAGEAGQGLLGVGPVPGFSDGQGVQQDLWSQDTDSWAVFTHNIWHATDRFDVTLGLRFTDEEKTLRGNLTAVNPACIAIAQSILAMAPIIGPLGAQLSCNPLINPFVDNNALLNPAWPNGYTDKHDDSEWSGVLSLAYRFNDAWLGYVSYSRGYKAGGFNLDRSGLDSPLTGGTPDPSQLEFRNETVDSYEAGVKSTIWDDRLSVNVAGFFAQYDDFQLNEFTGTNFVVTNLSEVESKGVEVELAMAPVGGFSLQGGVTYTDARYDESVSVANLAGQRLTNAPYWIITAAGNYERQLTAALSSYVQLNYRFNSDMNTGSDLDPQKKQASYAIWNGMLGLTTADEQWQFELWGKNLFDAEYHQVVFTAPLQTGTYASFLGDERTWGGNVRFNF